MQCSFVEIYLKVATEKYLCEKFQCVKAMSHIFTTVQSDLSCSVTKSHQMSRKIETDKLINSQY